MDLSTYDELYFRPYTKWTGAGTSLAVIEHTARRGHPCFAKNIAAYCPASRSAYFPCSPEMHPSTTLSIMVGQSRAFPRLGLAPEASVRFFETQPFGAIKKTVTLPFENKLKLYLEREGLGHLRRIREEIANGKRTDAVVFFFGLGSSGVGKRVTDRILHVIADIESLSSTAVFYPAEPNVPVVGSNERGVCAWTGGEIGSDALALPIGNRIVAGYRDDGYYRETKYPGICWQVATLAGGFALLRQARPTLSKKEYYELLQDTAQPVDYGHGRLVRTVSYQKAVDALSL